LIALGAVAVIAAVLAALLIGSDDESAPTEARPGPELGPLTLSERVWTAEDVTVSLNSGAIRIRDDRILFRTETGILLIDVESGAGLWTQNDQVELRDQTVAMDLSASPQLPLLVRHGDGVGVLVGYDVFGCDLVEPGVALLSGENGDVVWRAPTAPAEGCAQNMVHWKQQLWAADDTTALVSVAPNGGDPDDLGQVRVLALDVATGQRKWEHQGAWPQAIAGGVALVSTDKPVPAGFTGPGTVTALDLATGAPKWSLADRYPVAHLMHAVGDVVVVATNDESGDNEVVRVLDAATGREVATLPEADPGFCVADATLVACRADPLTRGPQLVTFRQEDQAVMTVPLEEHTSLLSVVEGRISVDILRREPSIVTIDRTGNVIDEKPPGELLAMTDDLLLVSTTPDQDEEEESLALYRVNG
jgi:outer membrane protein assembly factor BamB